MGTADEPTGASAAQTVASVAFAIAFALALLLGVVGLWFQFVIEPTDTALFQAAQGRLLWRAAAVVVALCVARVVFGRWSRSSGGAAWAVVGVVAVLVPAAACTVAFTRLHPRSGNAFDGFDPPAGAQRSFVRSEPSADSVRHEQVWRSRRPVVELCAETLAEVERWVDKGSSEVSFDSADDCFVRGARGSSRIESWVSPPGSGTPYSQISVVVAQRR